MSSGAFCLTRTAAFIRLLPDRNSQEPLPRRRDLLRLLFEIDEFVITGITEMLIQPDPGCGVKERLAGQCPALHVELLELVAIAFDHDIAVLADALDFGKSGPQLEDLEVVERTEGNNEVERLVAERIAVLRPVAEQIILDLGVGVGEPVFRYVEADQFGLGQQPLELAQQVALAAADIEDANLALQTVQVDQPLRHRRPAALDVAIAAIAVAPVAVPIVAFVFLRL